MASNELDPEHRTMDEPHATKDEDAAEEGPSGNGFAGEGREGVPACLAPPSPPSLRPKRRPVDSSRNSLVDDTVTQFKKQCAIRGGLTSRATTEAAAAAVLPRPPTREINKENLEARESEAQAWVESVTGKPFLAYETKEFARNLKSGERLCTLVNIIRPGTILHVHESQLGFEQMENIDNFIASCCKLGVPPYALVGTADVFEMEDTPAVVACVHAFASAVQTSCLMFEGPHLGLAADPSLVAMVLSVEDEARERDDRDIDSDSDSENDNDNKDNSRVPGDFWRTSRPGGAAALEKKHNGEASAELVLNMKDVERPRTVRRGFNTTVGSISDLGPPAPLSARARKMCPEELVNSPRALVYNADPIGHPTRSPTMRTLGGSTRGGRNAWGTDVYPAMRTTQTPSKISPGPFHSQRLSPAGLWGGAGRIPRRDSEESLPANKNKKCETATSAGGENARERVESVDGGKEKNPEEFPTTP